jgi:exopolysaccharide biosynthesis polyprenyl glycosylphosphotransferase
LLLPDTDEEGVKLCAEKILRGNGQIPLSVNTATYPDHVFQELLKEEENHSNLFSLYLDETMNPQWFQGAFKKGIDILGALTGIILFSPIMLIVALAVKISSPGPIIFEQTRLGLKGRRFPFYKYRSMYVNMDDRIHRDYVSNLIEGQLEKINQGEKENPFFKIKDDPRITQVGKIIRKLSIDELPQFFNVLKGEMSLVGPRPPIPYEIEKYKPWHLRRILEKKPGITGLWQVSGSSRTTFDEMVRLDLRYVQNWSVWLDLKILFKTVKEVFYPQDAA